MGRENASSTTARPGCRYAALDRFPRRVASEKEHGGFRFAHAEPLRAGLTSIVVLSLVLGGCAPSTPAVPSQREFYTYRATSTAFGYRGITDYSTVWLRSMGMASSGETRFRDSNDVIFRATLLEVDAKARLLLFKAVYLKNGTALIQADVARDMSCRVVSAILNGAVRSEYSYVSHRDPIPLIRTIDVATGKVLSTTSGVELMGDGTFRVQEADYRDGRETFRSVSRRHAGTGLILDESVQNGVLERDYHHYELMLDNWSRCEPNR